jgi:hypothetical protein
MNKLICPRCNNPGISVIRKVFLGPGATTKCESCGQNLSVQFYKSLLILMPWLTVFLIIPIFGLLLLPAGIFIYIKWLPFVTKD